MKDAQRMETGKKMLRSTIEDIARAAGVSITTVSRVLNGSVAVAQPTASRVWDAIDRLDYTPSAAAKSLASKTTRTIGLLLPGISGVFFAPMLRGIESCTNQSGYDLLVYSSNHNDQPGKVFKRPIGDQNTDGLLVFTSSLSEPELAWFYRRGFPIVLLHRSAPEGLKIPSVSFENQQGVERLIDHLIEVHGCQRIALFRGPADSEDAYTREAGYRAALERHHLPVLPELITRGDYDTHVAAQSMQQLLDQEVPMDAIFAGDDEAAAGICLTLTQRGVRIPEDIRVVGFDDNSLAPLLPAPLTTVHAPIEAAGFEAARQLINLIQTGQSEGQVVFPTELVIRRSCGCAFAAV